jgi:hypothetical protein
VEVFRDPADSLVPPGSYVADLVLAAKGILTPTRFAIWGALSQIAAVLKRSAWIQWYPDRLFPNIFVVLVGLARWGGKGDIIDKFTDKLLREYWHRIPDERLRIEKIPQIFHSKVTSQKLFESLSNREVKVVEGNKTKTLKKPWSDACLLMSELGTFLTREKFNETIIQKLCDLYSCKDEDDDSTISRGKINVTDTYVTLFGATTTEALENCLPASAIGDGFVSRTAFVQMLDIVREWEKPYEVVADAFPQLEERLAWIAVNIKGEHSLSPEADVEYTRLYKQLIEWTKANRGSKEVAVRSRYDIQVLKVSLLIHAARYDTSPLITREDFLAAEAIVKDSFSDSYEVLARVGEAAETRQKETVKQFLIKKGASNRQDILRRFSSNHGRSAIRAKMMNAIIEDLFQEGHLRITTADGQKTNQPQGHGLEVYKWVN